MSEPTTGGAVDWAEFDSKVLLSCVKWAVVLCSVALVIEWLMFV